MDTALLVSVVCVVVTAAGGVLVARVTGRSAETAADRSASATDAARISNDLWRMIEYERKRTDEAVTRLEACERDRAALEDERDKLTVVLEITANNRQVDAATNLAQSLVYARDLAAKWPGAVADLERRVENARNVLVGKLAYTEERRREAEAEAAEQSERAAAALERATRAEDRTARLSAAYADLQRQVQTQALELERCHRDADDLRETAERLRRRIRDLGGRTTGPLPRDDE